MLRPTAKSVETRDDFVLRLLFDNNEVKDFDVKPYIQGDFFSHLGNPDYFKLVKPNGYNVEWPEGQDLCPDELYFNSVSVKSY